MNNKLLVILLTISSLSAFSQLNQCVYFGGNAGMNSLMYSVKEGSSTPKLSYGGNIGYIYYFTPNWGIGTGVGVYLCATDGRLNGTKISIEGQIDDDWEHSPGETYRKDIYFRDWHEKQSFLLAEVPILVHYRYDFGLNKRREMYIQMGIRAQLPLMASYEITRGEVELRGYYSKWNVELFEIIDPDRFVTRPIKGNGTLSLPFDIGACFGIGFSFEVSKIIDIYMGGYFNYGFLNLKSGNNGELLYLENDQIKYRGILLSSITEKVHLISAQGELGMRFSIGKPFTRAGYKRR